MNSDERLHNNLHPALSISVTTCGALIRNLRQCRPFVSSIFCNVFAFEKIETQSVFKKQFLATFQTEAFKLIASY